MKSILPLFFLVPTPILFSPSSPQGNSHLSQVMQRTRVGFQFGTISYALYVFKPWEAKTEQDPWTGEQVKEMHRQER